MNSDTELNKELLKRIKDGNEKAFQLVFNSYFPGLLAFTKEYVQDEEVAKNLIQESFLKLWEVKNELQNDSNIKAFLYQILRNKALNFLKAQKVRQKYEERLKYKYNESVLNYEALHQLDFNSVTFKELSEIIEKVIQSLPPQCKKVFQLSRYESMKNREIADELGISVKAVEGQMSKALKKLREQLKKHFPSDFLTILMTIV